MGKKKKKAIENPGIIESFQTSKAGSTMLVKTSLHKLYIGCSQHFS